MPVSETVGVKWLLSLYVSPVINWRVVQGAPHHLPIVSCNTVKNKRLQMMNEWICWHKNIFSMTFKPNLDWIRHWGENASRPIHFECGEGIKAAALLHWVDKN